MNGWKGMFFILFLFSEQLFVSAIRIMFFEAYRIATHCMRAAAAKADLAVCFQESRRGSRLPLNCWWCGVVLRGGSPTARPCFAPESRSEKYVCLIYPNRSLGEQRERRSRISTTESAVALTLLLSADLTIIALR